LENHRTTTISEEKIGYLIKNVTDLRDQAGGGEKDSLGQRGKVRFIAPKKKEGPAFVSKKGFVTFEIKKVWKIQSLQIRSGSWKVIEKT